MVSCSRYCSVPSVGAMYVSCVLYLLMFVASPRYAEDVCGTGRMSGFLQHACHAGGIHVMQVQVCPQTNVTKRVCAALPATSTN